MTSSLRGADIVARSLARLGCKRVFTLSGNHIMSGFEAAAVHMADTHGRLTGEAGIALVTGGPGHANAVGALYTALAAESPMVLLSGHAATWELGRGGFQEIRQADMAAPVSKASWTALKAAELGRDLGEAVAGRHHRPAGSGACESALRSPGGARRGKRHRLAGARNGWGASARRGQGRRDPRRARGRRVAHHYRRAAA